METPDANKSIWRKAGLFAAIVALFCFFMPWIEMGVSFIKTNMSGWQLATGSGPARLSTPSWPSLLLIPLSMLAVIVITGPPLIGQRLPIRIEAKQIARLLIAAGGLSLLVLVYQYINLNSQFNRNWLGAIAQTMVSYVFGWMLTLLGNAVVLAAGIMELRANNSARQDPLTSRAGSWMDQP
ncbi:MAG: hypothetical protein MOB07_20680 [Acidobacteria bacterium]|nr:hypothetical protein [Acidobacteriota bacterium]